MFHNRLGWDTAIACNKETFGDDSSLGRGSNIRQIAETDEAKGLLENAKAGKKGSAIAKDARFALEAKTGKTVVTGENFLPASKKIKQIDSKNRK